jgi:hypothetical protein
MGMHILHDRAIQNRYNPCGFCLRSNCHVRLKKGKGRKGGESVDKEKSTCPNAVSLSLASASKSTTSSPCSNVPRQCPLCEAIIWKYNLKVHIETTHPNATIANYEHHYRIEKTERIALKLFYEKRDKRRWTTIRNQNIGDINVSEAHNARLALR